MWGTTQGRPSIQTPLSVALASPLVPLTRMVVTTRVLLASVCDRLMSRVVAFMANVLLEYHTPIWGAEGAPISTGLQQAQARLTHPFMVSGTAPPGSLTSRWPCRDFSRMRRV